MERFKVDDEAAFQMLMQVVPEHQREAHRRREVAHDRVPQPLTPPATRRGAVRPPAQEGRKRGTMATPPPRRGVTQYASATVKETTRDDLGHRHQRAHRSPGATQALRVRWDGTTGGDLTDHDFRTLAADLSLTLEAVAALCARSASAPTPPPTACSPWPSTSTWAP